MSFKKLKNCLVVVALCMMWVQVYSSQTKAQAEIHFGEAMRVIQFHDRIIRQPILSPDGRFLFANGDQYEIFRERREDGLIIADASRVLNTSQYIWDLQDVSETSDAVILTPSQTLSANGDLRTAGRFSPDGRYLALKTDTELQVWTLPELRLEKTVAAISSMDSNVFYRYLAWSSDGQLLAAVIEGGIVVWDIEQDRTVHYMLPYEYEWLELQPISNGWFINIADYTHFGDRDQDTAFTVCSLLLESCNTYDYPNYDLSFVTPDGSGVFIPFGDTYKGGVVAVWRNQGDVTYSLETEWQQSTFASMGVLGLCLQTFSPNSVYIVSECYKTISIHRLSTQEPLAIIHDQNIRFLSWLPDNEHFVVLREPTLESDFFELHLYRFGEDAPTDVVAIGQLPGIGNVADFYTRAFNEDEYSSISADGSEFLLNMGFIAVIIPFEFGQGE